MATAKIVLAHSQMYGKKFRLTAAERERARSRFLQKCGEHPEKVLNMDVKARFEELGMEFDATTRDLMQDGMIRAMKAGK